MKLDFGDGGSSATLSTRLCTTDCNSGQSVSFPVKNHLYIALAPAAIPKILAIYAIFTAELSHSFSIVSDELEPFFRSLLFSARNAVSFLPAATPFGFLVFGGGVSTCRVVHHLVWFQKSFVH